MKPHKHAELIKAWADGAEIECDFGDDHWVTKMHAEWYDHLTYRIKPPEVPQWRKDMAQALLDGKVVEWSIGGEWEETILNPESFLNPESRLDKEKHYRIKPEPKPDDIGYYNIGTTKGVYKHDDSDNWDLKLTFDGETGEPKDAEVFKCV